MFSVNDNLLSIEYILYLELKLRSDLPKSRCGALIIFLKKMTFSACLAHSGLNDNFHWYVCSSISNRSLLSVAVETFTQFTMINKEVSLVKNSTLELSSCRKLIT